MAGERTPDTSGNDLSGSSDDDISLREHMQRQLDSQARFTERLHTEQGGYFERIIKDMWERLNERFKAQQNAVDELKTATSQRFESVNEFRAQLNDQARLFMGRDESISRHERTQEQLNSNLLRHDNEMRLMRERFEQELKALRERIDTDFRTVNSRLDLTQGQSHGQDKTWGIIFAAAAFASAIIGIIAYAIGAS